MPSILSNSRILLALTGSFILLSFFLGGISKPSRLTDAVLQLASLPLFLYALWHLPSMKWTVSQRRACLLCLCFLLLPLVQLIPIPPSLWMIFPFRNWSGEVFGILNRPFEWMPLSLAPERTWLSALSLLPPMAVFLALVQMNETLRQKISLLLVGSGCFMAILAILQFSQGPSSVLRVFEYTQQEEAVGFFANRNHLAAFLLGMLVLAAAIVIKNSRPFLQEGLGVQDLESKKILPLLASVSAFFVILAGEVLARSRAGLILTIVSFFGIYGLLFVHRSKISQLRSHWFLKGAGILLVGFFLQYALYRALQRFSVDPLEDARIMIFQNTWSAIKALMPVGSGMGTFVPIYEMFEAPSDLLFNTYVNRAHNEVLELLLEGGVLSLLLMIIFAFWFLLRTTYVWYSSSLSENQEDRLLPQAASLILLLLILHSLVDYPLRTAAIMVVFAVCCALLVDPPLAEERQKVSKSAERRFESPPRSTRSDPPAVKSGELVLTEPLFAKKMKLSVGEKTPKASETKLVPVRERWGSDMDWPEEWADSSKEISSKPSSSKSQSPQTQGKKFDPWG